MVKITIEYLQALSQCRQNLGAYRDVYGLLVHAAPARASEGDSCNRTMAATVYFNTLGFIRTDEGLEVKEGYAGDRLHFERSPGRYCRHPEGGWVADIDNFTRDQSIVLQAAMVVMQDKTSMVALFKQRIKRLMFHFNTVAGDDTPGSYETHFPDPPSPIEIAQFIRGMRLAVFYPLLLLLDLQLLIDLLIVRPIAKRNRNKDFDVQFLPILLSCLSYYKTPVGSLAKFIYARTPNVESELRRYFKEGEGLNGLEPLGELAVFAYQRAVVCK